MSTSELLGAIRSHPVWRDAPDQLVRALAAQTKDARFRPGQRVLESGGPAKLIHLLIEGAVRVFYPKSDDGGEVTVKLFWAPASFGDPEAILRATWAETVEALTPARVLITDAAQYFRLIQLDAGVCFRQYWDLGRAFGTAILAQRAAHFADVRDRLIALFVSYGNHFGREDAEHGLLIDFPLTQDDIARQVGWNRRSVVRVLNGLYEDQLVVRVGRRYALPNRDLLLASATHPTPDLSFKTEARPWAEIKR